MPKIIQGFCILLLATLVPACSDDPLSKEDQIRRYIDTGVAAAEDRSHRDLVELIDDGYSDQKAMDKTRIGKLLQAYFFRHKNIYLLTKIREISFPSEDEANVSLYVAMTGSVISDINALSSLRARIYRFELQLVKDESWLLREASWQVANMSDMQ